MIQFKDLLKLAILFMANPKIKLLVKDPVSGKYVYVTAKPEFFTDIASIRGGKIRSAKLCEYFEYDSSSDVGFQGSSVCNLFKDPYSPTNLPNLIIFGRNEVDDATLWVKGTSEDFGIEPVVSNINLETFGSNMVASQDLQTIVSIDSTTLGRLYVSNDGGLTFITHDLKVTIVGGAVTDPADLTEPCISANGQHIFVGHLTSSITAGFISHDGGITFTTLINETIAFLEYTGGFISDDGLTLLLKSEERATRVDVSYNGGLDITTITETTTNNIGLHMSRDGSVMAYSHRVDAEPLPTGIIAISTDSGSTFNEQTILEEPGAILFSNYTADVIWIQGYNGIHIARAVNGYLIETKIADSNYVIMDVSEKGTTAIYKYLNTGTSYITEDSLTTSKALTHSTAPYDVARVTADGSTVLVIAAGIPLSGYFNNDFDTQIPIPNGYIVGATNYLALLINRS